MEMAPAVDPHPGRVPKEDLLNPGNLSAMAAELYIVFGKILWGLGFFVEDDFISIEGGREVPHRAGVGPTRGWTLGRGSRPPWIVGCPLGRPFGSGLHLSNKKSP